MLVRILSDLHLEFGQFDPGEGNVLVLPGDICTASSYHFRGEEMYLERYQQFFETAASRYDKVFYVMGNHEYYNFYWSETERVLRENLPAGITLLENQVEKYNGWSFLGTTLWSNFEGGKKESMDTCEEWMNEYRCVERCPNSPHQFIKPEDVRQKHCTARKWLDETLEKRNGNCFVITHHCPSFKSVESGYRESDTLGAYASDVEDIAEKHDNLRIWVHGHVHCNNSYMLHGTKVISNPRGYHGEDENHNFNPNLQIDLTFLSK